MLLAELEIFHSRPIAPTRRVAVGRCRLPLEPAPGPGAVLLAGVVAGFLPQVDADFHADYLTLLRELERGARISQPRLRYRLQQDRVGLTRTRHRLYRDDAGFLVVLDGDKATPAQHVLGAAYAAGAVPFSQRSDLMNMLRKGAAYDGPIDRRFIAHLTGYNGSYVTSWGTSDPLLWALELLGLDPAGDDPDRATVQRRFRDLLRGAHPDTGGEDEKAARRIADLSEARRILLA